MENQKVWYKSNIIWLSIATIIIGSSEYIAVLNQYIPEQYQGLFTSLTGILIVIARVYSSNNNITATNPKRRVEEKVVEKVIDEVKPKTATKSTTKKK